MRTRIWKGFQAILVLSMLGMTGSWVQAQGLSLELAGQSGSSVTVAVRYEAGPAAVTALQFDITFDQALLDGLSLKPMRGKDLLPGFQMEARQVQPGTIRVLLIPPLKTDLPPLSGGEIASFSFALKSAGELSVQSIDFVRRSAVFSDRQGKSVVVRGLQNNIGRSRRVTK